MSIPARALRALITLYQRVSSNRLPHCRYTPSCSAYAVRALEIHGAARGSWLALRRIARCRPGGGFGYDPCPPRSERPLGPVPPRSERPLGPVPPRSERPLGPVPQEMTGV